MSKSKERLDILLVKKGLVISREKAKALIMAGAVFSGAHRLDKPGMELPEDTDIIIKGEQPPFVSRGGLKLDRAVKVFSLNFEDQTVADIGASTGGFTDCALQHGAVKVYAIDVGYGQLDWRLRSDPRVVSMERVNARYLESTSLPEQVDWIVSDVSFISITKIFTAMSAILKPDGQIIILIKPQFEAGREHVGKKGVVKDPLVHESVIGSVLGEAESVGFFVKGLSYSPIKGPEGNIEYLAWLSRNINDRVDWDSVVKEVVALAHQETE